MYSLFRGVVIRASKVLIKARPQSVVNGSENCTQFPLLYIFLRSFPISAQLSCNGPNWE